MSSQTFMEVLLEAVGCDSQAAEQGEESIIGIFQSFRPDGMPDRLPWHEIAGGLAFQDRLASLFEAVRNSVRADALRDAYFIVRNPPMLSADRAEGHAIQLIDQLLGISTSIGFEDGIRLLEKRPTIRVLEGKAPKHPRRPEEKCPLLRLLQSELPTAIDQVIDNNSLAGKLSEALYFVACDRLLRDYLRWPLMTAESATDLAAWDPLSYFELWRHGVKYRVFSDHQIDIYLPRRASGTLLDAGQFANGKRLGAPDLN